MSHSAMFQPEWNAFPRRQFRHLEMLDRAGQPLTGRGSGQSGERCLCLECGREFGVQREGAMYTCERCSAKQD